MKAPEETIYHLKVALAAEDPFSTDMAMGDRLSEYSMEAEWVARRLAAGEPLEASIDSAFKELAEVELSNESLRRICARFDAESDLS